MAKKEAEKKEAGEQNLLSHFKELRRRLFYALILFFVAFLVAFFYAKPIFNVLVRPLEALWQGDPTRGMIYTAMHEQFLTEIKLALFAALLIGLPLMSTQVWLFVAPGLYRQEKGAMLPFLIATPILFYIGAAFVYFIVLPLAWKFFLGFEQARGAEALAIRLEPKVNEYLSLVTRLILAFGICFELPVLLTLLARVGLATPEGLRRRRRYAVLIAFIVAAVLTPPDPLSQIALAVPVIVLYEISIWATYFFAARRRKQNA